jgi:hypothetical protein
MTCRICFEEGDLFAPCECKGTNRFVHRVCLEKWRQTSELAETQCPVCRYTYRLSFDRHRVIKKWETWFENAYPIAALLSLCEFSEIVYLLWCDWVSTPNDICSEGLSMETVKALSSHETSIYIVMVLGVLMELGVKLARHLYPQATVLSIE